MKYLKYRRNPINRAEIIRKKIKRINKIKRLFKNAIL